MEHEPKRLRMSTSNWPAPSFQPQHPHHHHGPPHHASLDGSAGAPTPGANPSPPIPTPLDDRRHSNAETDQYGRTPSTPTTHYPLCPPFSLRDTTTAIKRDPGGDDGPPPPQQQQQQHPPSLPQPSVARRPQSTSGDGIPPTTPNTIPPPSPYADGPHRHMSAFDSSGAPAHMNPYRPAHFPAPSSMSHPPQPPPYDSGYGGQHGPPEPMYSVYQTSVSNTKRKATRASQACDSCRSLKAKCDETKPCKGCREKGLECKYRDPIPKATDKAQADILDGINDVKSMLQDFASEVSQVRERMLRLESALAQVNPSFDFKPHPDAPRLGSNGSRENSYAGPASDAGPVQPMPDEEEEMEDRPGPFVAPGEPAIPVNHTTLAGLLLGWPAIKEMVHGLLEKERIEFVSEYPIRQEQERGLLRVYGRGEGHDSRYSKDDHGFIDIGDDVSDIASPVADWGTLGYGPLDLKVSTSSTSGGGFGSSASVALGGGGPALDGSPDFTPEVVWSYIRSFRENILHLMPIIMPNELNAMVQAFLESLPHKPSKPASTPTVAKGFAVQSPIESVGSKRKRSPSPEGSRLSTASYRSAKPLRTITNAVVLVALALGKICQHKENVPDVVHTSSSPTQGQGSPLFRSGVPASPTQPSPVMRSHAAPSPSEWERRRSSHGGLVSRPTYSSKKNYDVIPGLEYFAYATDIIGNQLGGTSMKHVWASVLAGLYHGQLGRVMESYAYISNGSKILQIIMRPSLDRLRQIRENAPTLMIEKKRDNQIAFAFWTCLQLESDILAELPLPHSGILAHEGCIPYPNILLPEDAYEPRVFESYMAQLYLRRHLNSIHKLFYHPDVDVRLNPDQEDISDMRVVKDRIDTMKWVSPSFRFNESDPPASDILGARLRAKYWGAQVITYRPFIKQILQFTHDVRTQQGREPNSDDYDQINNRAVHYAELGIRALIESTRAFHNLGNNRPIITNVFGTAHAQWGNMLVLSAVSLDPFLRRFVERDQLRLLFDKTLRFLRRSSTASCNLRRDMRILEGVQEHVFARLPPLHVSAATEDGNAPVATSLSSGGLSLQNHGYDVAMAQQHPPYAHPQASSVHG